MRLLHSWHNLQLRDNQSQVIQTPTEPNPSSLYPRIAEWVSSDNAVQVVLEVQIQVAFLCYYQLLSTWGHFIWTIPLAGVLRLKSASELLAGLLQHRLLGSLTISN